MHEIDERAHEIVQSRKHTRPASRINNLSGQNNLTHSKAFQQLEMAAVKFVVLLGVVLVSVLLIFQDAVYARELTEANGWYFSCFNN
jgi:hypothetical protein